MKVSSTSGNTIETGLIFDDETIPMFQETKRNIASLLNTIERIGTSIALGETGDLDAAHEFRIISSRKNI